MSTRIPPRGIYVPVPTFFVPPSSPIYDPITPPLDLPTQSAHAIHLAECGIRGILLLGSSGEAIMISNAERKELITHVRQELDKAGFKSYPIMAGTATQGIEDTLEQLLISHEAGADWGMVLAPGYFAPVVTQEGLVDWYTAIADRSPMPIMIYHYPAVSNNIALTPDTLLKLSRHENIVGTKLSHANLSHHALTALSAPPSFPVFTGLGQHLLPFLTVGGAGAIDGLAGMFPRTVVALYDGFDDVESGPLFENDGQPAGLRNSIREILEDRTEAMQRLRGLQRAIAAGEELIVKWGTVGVKEGVSRVLRFGDPRGTRLPLKGGLPDGAWKEFEGAFEELGRVEGDLKEGHR